LTATLTAPVSFARGVDQSKIDVAEVLCEGGVAVDHHPADAVGPTSHERLSLAQSLSVNMVTGAIAGQGRGWLRSVHFGGGLDQLANSAPAAQLAVNAAGRQKLNFLRVDFDRGLSGNLHVHELTFHERVRTIYGPVDRWDQELNPNRRPVGSMILSCDNLGINEDPIAVRAARQPVGLNMANRQVGPIQMRAVGNVTLEGDLENSGIFAARGNLASFDQQKDRVTLEGDPRSPAVIKMQRQPGAQPNEMSALKIHYTRSTGNVRMEGIQSLNIGPGNPLEATRPGLDR
jgi:lipopolysaccharide export system protein LptA